MTFLLFEPAQPGEDGASGAVEGAGQIGDRGMWLDTQLADQSTVERIEPCWAIVQGGHLALPAGPELIMLVQHRSDDSAI